MYCDVTVIVTIVVITCWQLNVGVYSIGVCCVTHLAPLYNS